MHLRGYLSLTVQTAIPYYVALLVQLAGNVEPVLRLTRDCVQRDPVDDDQAIVRWEKPRAGRAGKKLQARPFNTTKLYGPPALIEELLKMSAPYIERVEEQDRNRLFLVTVQGDAPASR